MRGWQQPLAIAQAIWNWGGPRGRNFKPKPLGELHEKMFPDFHGKAVPKMSLEEYHERVRKIEDALRERYREERADP